MAKEYIGYDDTEKYIQDQTEKPNWIYTYTGRKFSLTQPSKTDVHIDDLVYPLARVTRSNGHMVQKFSVLQHLLLCVELAKKQNESPRILLLLGMHDLPESYTGDCNSIFKALLKDLYAPIEHGIERAIFDHFGVEYMSDTEKQIVKKYDNLSFKYETHFLFKDDSWLNTPDEDFSGIEMISTYNEVPEGELIEAYKWVLIELLRQNGIEYTMEV